MKASRLEAVVRILDNYLEMNNHRKTPERYTILKAIYGINGHFTLEELNDKLATELGFPVCNGVGISCSQSNTLQHDKPVS